MSIDQERLDAFQARMNGWVSSQGLLFQLRHGGAVHGAKSPFIASMLRLMVRGAFVGIVLLLGLWIYLGQRIELDSFRDGLSAGMAAGLKADSVEISRVERKGGELMMGQVLIEGSEDSFFDAAELRQVRTSMDLTDGLWGSWEGANVSMMEMRAKLKSGADDDAGAARAFASLFDEAKGFQFNSLIVEEATVFWGYSQMHRGGIRDSRMRATRKDGGWEVVFTGGQFSQNWLKRLDIERIVVMVRPEGVSVPEMTLRWGEGTVNCQLAFVSGGARPGISGSGTMSGLPISKALESEFKDFIQGEISGSFEVDGLMNSQEGLGISMNIELAEGDTIELRDRFPLFGAISAVDRFRTYKRVRFKSGGCRIRSGAGQMQVDDMRLVADDLMWLEGAFLARPPTDQEVNALLNFEPEQTVGGGIAVSLEEPEADSDDEFTLKRAAKLAKDPKESDVSGGGPRLHITSNAALRNEEESRVRESQQLIGEVRLGFTTDTFSRSPSLEARYPTGADGMRWVTLPMKGSIYTVGEEETGLIYQCLEDER